LSLCDRCQRPGRCCSGFLLNGGDWPKNSKDMDAAQVKEALRQNPQVNVNGDIATVPFEPMWQDKKGWHFWCKAWVNGRCSIYSIRPKLCHDYEPLMDNLCWHYDAATVSLVLPPVEKGTFVDLLATETETETVPKLKVLAE
jgi:Fe-S-cluster containining protein